VRIVPLLPDGAVLLAGAGAVEVAFWWVPAEQGPSAGGFVGVLLLAAPLLWRRKAPALSAAAAALVWLGWSLLSPPQGSFVPWLLQLLALYAVGARAPEREAVLVLALWFGADAVFVASTTGAFADYVFVYGIGGALWLAGAVAARRQRTAVLAETRAAELERSRQREIEHAMAQERARIARELHDVVAHTVSVMVVQAAAAEQVLERAPAAARQSLAPSRRWAVRPSTRCGACSASCVRTTSAPRSPRPLG
jgi:signal transduction histidine kinase